MLVGLKWEHVNFINQTVRIIDTIITIDGVPTEAPPKSRRSRRVIDVRPLGIEPRTCGLRAMTWRYRPVMPDHGKC